MSTGMNYELLSLEMMNVHTGALTPGQFCRWVWAGSCMFMLLDLGVLRDNGPTSSGER